MKAYLDSSFLFSLYADDVHTAAALSDLKRFPGAFVLSALSELEMVNALELRIFRKELARAQVDQARDAFDGDLRAGTFSVFDLEPATFLRARRLVLETTGQIGGRAADVLHVAAALEVSADRFFSFDQRQKLLARRAKLATN